MNKVWWKLLGILIMLYVFAIGLTTPLKPGITSSSPKTAVAGENVTLKITTYNSFHQKAKEIRAWLKLDSVHLIQAKEVEVISDNELSLNFGIPAHLPSEDKIIAPTLILDSDVDATSVLPSALFIQKDESNDVEKGQSLWKIDTLKDIHQLDAFRFPYRGILNETVRNIFFHVSIWFAMFILLIASLWYSIKYLRGKRFDDDIIASSLTGIAILYGALGLITGSIWAKFTWGTFWTTDIKLNMTAVAMLIYVAYLILRNNIADQDRRARLSAVYNIFAFAAMIPLIFVIPRMTDSLHPGNGGNPALGGEDLDNTLRMVFYPAVIGLTLIGLWMTSLLIRYERLKNKWFLDSNDQSST